VDNLRVEESEGCEQVFLRYHGTDFLENVKILAKNLNEDNLFSGQDWNLVCPKQETRALSNLATDILKHYVIINSF
jgi:hypothetical protein